MQLPHLTARTSTKRSLTAELAARGYTHKRSHANSSRHDVFYGDLKVFTGNAAEVWQWLAITPDKARQADLAAEIEVCIQEIESLLLVGAVSLDVSCFCSRSFHDTWGRLNVGDSVNDLPDPVTDFFFMVCPPSSGKPVTSFRVYVSGHNGHVDWTREQLAAELMTRIYQCPILASNDVHEIRRDGSYVAMPELWFQGLVSRGRAVAVPS